MKSRYTAKTKSIPVEAMAKPPGSREYSLNLPENAGRGKEEMETRGFRPQPGNQPPPSAP
ncbi:MAG: hypothetical protein Kow00109_04580 [Acidobacteriota bacterium]